MSKTVEEYVEAIPEEMRGHVFHALGKSLGHGGAQPQDSGGTTPPPPPPGTHNN